MNIAVNIVIIILVFGVIVFIHEFGHFLFAKLNKIGVEEFAIGMGPAIASFEKKGTKYSIRILPIGGYCLMVGENEESEEENAFNNKSVLARISVVLAGPFFNFILAFILSIVLCHYCGIDPPNVYVSEDGAAKEAGLRDGDLITEIDGGNIYNYRELLVYMQINNNSSPVEITYERDGNEYTTVVTPKQGEDGVYRIGVASGYVEAENFLEEVKYGAYEVRYWIKSVFISLRMLVTGQAGADDLMGPVGVGNMMNDVIEEANENGGMVDVILNVINFCVLISANLGVMNLLPIPALDGGRLLFLIIEAITRKRIPEDKEAIVNGIGFVLVMLLMVFVLFNDISNVFFK